MRFGVAAFIAAALLAWATATLAKAAPTGAARVNGREYVRVTDWAKANGFEPRWMKKDQDLQLSRGAQRISLSIDSTDARLDGVALKLCYPVAAHDGVPWLSQIDVQETFRPLLSPPKNRAGALVRNICLDPGHGGNDPGNTVGSNFEKKYTLLLALEVQQQLSRAGFKVSLTRTRDSALDLPIRPDIAKRRNGDLLISLHFNSAPTSASTVRGVEVYCMTPPGAPSSNARGEGAGAGRYPGNRLNEKNLYLAYLLQRSLAPALGTEDRGVHRARFAVLREAVMPAVLIEGGFMSHPAEGRKIYDPAYRKQMAKAIVAGITAYKKQVEQGG